MMKKLLKFLSYNDELTTQIKFTYIINAFSMANVLLFFIFYLLVVKSILINLMTLFCLLILLSAFVFLKFKKFYLARIMMILGFLMQECALVFLFFPIDTNLNLFFFIVAPITFFIFNTQNPKERFFIVFINIIAITLFMLSEMVQVKAIIDISPIMVHFFGILSVVSTTTSIFIVYFFYAETLGQSQRELQRLANTDELTSIYNRRSLFREGRYIFKLSKKISRSHSMILIDIDFFKKVNDQFGHPAGDSVLRQLTELLKSNIRQHDILARYGGEEFAIILSDISKKNSAKTAENLRKRIEETAFPIGEGKEVHLTISIGLCNFDSQYKSFDQVLMNADRALYAAKQAGRNRVQVYKDALSSTVEKGHTDQGIQ